MSTLARQTGLSQSFSSQLESGLTSSGLRSLQKIADALGISATSLLAEAGTYQVPVSRADDRSMGISADADGRARSLVRGNRLLKGLEFSGMARDDREFTHESDELLYVVTGSALMTLRASRASGPRNSRRETPSMSMRT
ncbi:helix-turn-helix domain-containing protein [Rhodococcus sp. NPDC058521]|uniref:helix-turn-helix domain-containing protein n=1 Tax=Rhodococcus sp. NPDC058521 TaxID=3346536 RepID=UPI003647C110